MKILMVCLGNICRSPLAEGIMKSKLPEDFEVDSAGTISMHEGSLPDRRSMSTALEHGIDLSNQRSRPIAKRDLETFDIIFCMDKNNLKDVLTLAKTDEQRAKIKLILAASGNKDIQEVPDPYYGGIDGFEKVYQMLDKACTILAEELVKEA